MSDYVNEGSLGRIKERIIFEGSEFAGPCNQLPTASESLVYAEAEPRTPPNKKKRLGSLGANLNMSCPFPRAKV